MLVSDAARDTSVDVSKDVAAWAGVRRIDKAEAKHESVDVVKLSDFGPFR